MHRLQVPAGAPPVARTFRLAAIAVAVAGFDQATKAWAVRALDDRPLEIVGSAVQFRLTRNSGGAFSLFTGFTPVLAVLATLLVVVLIRMSRHETDPWLAASLAVVLGGAFGNLADRVFRDPGFLEGAVVDFVDVGSWPTFNVADSAIVVGAIIMILRGWRETGDTRDEGDTRDTSDDSDASDPGDADPSERPA